MKKILEFAMTEPRKAKVDREKGTISDVHFCGLESLNGYDYLPDGLKKAVAEGKYNGVQIWDLHPSRDEIAKGEIRRGMGDHVGVSFESSFDEKTGVWGSLHVNKETELGRSLLWNAENNPRGFGLSHEALVSEPEKVEGRDRLCVKDVDVVECMVTCPDPATTRGLFESVNRNKGDAVLKSDSEPAKKGAEGIKMDAAEIKKLIDESLKTQKDSILESLKEQRKEDEKDATIKRLESELQAAKEGQAEAAFNNDMAKLTVDHSLSSKEVEFLKPTLKSMEGFDQREAHVKRYRELNPASGKARSGRTPPRDPLASFESAGAGSQKVHEFAEAPMNDDKAKAVGESLKTGVDLPSAK